MCDPVTAMVVTTGLMMAQTKMQYDAQGAQADYQQQVANNNATLAEREAIAAKERGKSDVRRHNKNVQRMISQQRSVLAASGVIVDDEDALRTITDTAYMGEMDAEVIRMNAESTAFNKRVDAANNRHAGEVAQVTGRNNQNATILNGLTGMASMGMNAQQSGMFSSGGTNNGYSGRRGSMADGNSRSIGL